jgi:flagellar hook assembly protein FlgD
MVSSNGATQRDPLSGDTRMSWTLLRSAPVELVVIDITGRRIRHLASGVYSAGVHQFTWDGRDDDGRAVRTGAYFVAGRVGDERLSQRLFILR